MLFKNCLFWLPVTQDSWNGPKLIAAPIWHLLDINVPNFHTYAMRRSRKFCQRGSKFDNFFFSWCGDRGSKFHYKWAIISLPAKWHLNGVSLAGWWLPNIECWLCRLVIFQGIGTSIAKKPYIFLFFRGGPDPLSPPLDPPMYAFKSTKNYQKHQQELLHFPNMIELAMSILR